MSADVPARPDKRTELLDSAERRLRARGLPGTERRAAAARQPDLHAHVSTSTSSRRTGSSSRCLERRHARYLAALDATVDAGEAPVDALFDSLRDWIDGYGTSGCLYLRALGEYGDADEEIAGCARDYKRALRARVHECVRASLGRSDPATGDRVWLLFEGATAVAGVAGPDAVDVAAGAARALLAAAKPDGPRRDPPRADRSGPGPSQDANVRSA